MRQLLFCLAALLGLTISAAADTLPPPSQPPKVHVRLIADRDGVKPGSTFTVAVEQNIETGWHTYWLNPGEAGQPTEVKWSLPAGWKAGAIQWPYPIRIPVGPLMDYGYEGKVWLLMDLTVPADAAPGATTLKALVQYLVCREVCIPEDANVELPVVVDPKGAGPASSTAADFAAARAKIPAASPWPMRYALGQDLRLFLASPALAGTARPQDVQFFPAQPGEVTDAAKQSFGVAKDGLVVSLKPGGKMAGLKNLSGVLVLVSADRSVQALEVKAAPGPVPAAEMGGDFNFWLALAFAALGGLILNIMPCVLPVLAMKALALASHAGADRRHARAESFSYAAGAILSFVAFGLAVLALRAGGAAIGWGFQLQEPIVVAGLALLMFAVALNLSGVFEFQPISAGDALARKGGLTGAFFTGVLAVAVAAPCTAPFMATAIGYGFTQSAPVVVGIFIALGFGFALPFILIGLWPAIHRIFPKPGTWMVRFKQVLALPMYAAAGWLVWVLAQQVDRSGLIATAGAALALGLALWLWGRMPMLAGAVKTGVTFGAAVLLLAMVFALSFVAGAKPPAPVTVAAHAGMPSEPYTPAKLEALRKAGRPVFIDATASWCITCMVNEEAALSRPKVHEVFKQKNIALLVADWTNKNPEITALLEAHGRSGVPLYLYYAAGANDAKILPQILTEDQVLKALE
ncbi:thiol:disulfide interchange protein DsbD [Rhizomicrobium palustre]|uniref:Thiol:disulfide interchange protein DsbD n=1 Tax=Rhizomicrobium palustre TaxID=189966 RepID=A0A846MZI1_9PROT|nr:protein-disulfide reductase DsbD domain-containing protein [Rhizomicrobium palustre]NIK89074.1 thiol:disulfide interchange protein DsbD [Rhizomicrobium palustre]